jgi:hypothetical protein
MGNYEKPTKAFFWIRQNPFSSLLIVGFAVAVIKLYSLYTSVEVDDGYWQEFKAEHACVEQFGDKGTQRLSWKCDDGQIYYRWRQQR